MESGLPPKRLVARFGELVQMGHDLPLDEASALIGAVLSPDTSVDFEGQLARLDELAAAVRQPTIAGLVTSLFSGSNSFTGNQLDYYSPKNSLLHHVLDQRTGIPISLSTVTIEVGRRIGLDLCGVGMPAHFIVGVTPTTGLVPETFIDPFHGGQIMDIDQCRSLFHRVAGSHQPFDRRFLAVTPSLGILERVLNNLKAIYQRNGDVSALRTVMMLRSRLPGIGAVETDELRRLMAPLN